MSVLSSSANQGNESSKPLIPTHTRTPSWAGSEGRRARDGQSGQFFWSRIITVLLILGGCLMFGGSPTPSPTASVNVRTMVSSSDACAARLSFPKIALMFLIKGPLHHSEMWESWLEGAAGVVPAEFLGDQICEDEGASPADIVDACSRSRQHLFSVYLHVSAELDVDELLEPQWSLHAKNISRVVTWWGHNSLVEATRYLLARAFEDPANERFVLLSETHIPIWDPLTVYRVAMNQRRSSINAYYHDDMNWNRWTEKMLPVIPLNHWRKSQQWWTLIRSHAELVLLDSDVFEVFRQQCVMEFDFQNYRHRKCFSDEHFFATLLSIKGVEDETIPFFATTTYVDWSEGGAHPKSFLAEELTSDLLTNKLRSHKDCPLSPIDQRMLVKSASSSFIDIGELQSSNRERICDTSKSHGRFSKTAMPDSCATFARKFNEDTVDAVYSLLSEATVL